MRRVVFELDTMLKENELIVYKEGKLKSINVHTLLPELKTIRKDIIDLKNENKELKQAIVDLAKLVKEK